MSSAHCGMEIGDIVTFNGKDYVLRGFEPMSVPDRCAVLEDPETGDELAVPISVLEEPPSGGRSTPDP